MAENRTLRTPMSTQAESPERLLTGDAGRIAAVFSVGWLTLSMGRQVLPPLLPSIIDSLSITPLQAGFGLTLMWGVYALFHYPSGRASDRLSRKTVIAGGIGLLMAGFLVLIGTAAYLQFLVGALVLGIGTALYYVPMRARLADLFVNRRAAALGFNNAAGNVGSALAGGLAVAALAVATWRAAFVPIVAAFAVVLLLLHRLSDERYVVSRVDLEVRETAGRVFTPRVRWLAVAYSLFSFTNQAVIGFLPTFLQVDKGFSAAFASAGFSVLFVAGIVVSPIAGNLGDRFGRTHVSAASLVLAAAGLLGMLVASSPLLVVAGIATFAVGMRAYSPPIQAYLLGLFPESSMGGDYGAFKTIYILAGSFGPSYVGLAVEQVSYTLAYGGLAVCLVAATGIILWLAASE